MMPKDERSLQRIVSELAVSLTRYGIVGGLTVVVQAVVLILLTKNFFMSGIVSYTIAVAASLVVAYFGQSRWTFAARKSRSVINYFIIVLVSFAFGSGSTWLIVDWAKLSPYLTLPVMVVVIPFLSFLMLRTWAFK